MTARDHTVTHLHGQPAAVILAAGRGSRLGALTDDLPKCLTEVGGTTIIERQLEAIEATGITDVVVVTGYRAEAVRAVMGDRARFVHSPDWETTNSLWSLWTARDELGDDAIVLNCDVVFHPDALRRVVGAGPNCFAVDRFGGLTEEEMHVTLDGTRLVAMSKSIPSSRVHGENVGMVRLSGDALRAVLDAAERLFAAGRVDDWMASAIDPIAADHELHAVCISDLPWVEIDFPDDLEHAEARVWPAIRVSTEPAEVVLLDRARTAPSTLEVAA